MFLSFGGSAPKSQIFSKRINIKANCFAFCAAGVFTAVFLMPEYILAQSIELTPGTIKNHVEQEDDTYWLKASDNADNSYIIHRITSSWLYDKNLGIKDPHTSLKIGSSQEISNEWPVSMRVRNLVIHDGSFEVYTGLNSNLYLRVQENLIQNGGIISLYSSEGSLLPAIKASDTQLNNGKMHINVTNGTGLASDRLTKTGGNTLINISGRGSTGILTSDFQMSGGLLSLTGADHARAIDIEGGTFKLSGGTLRLYGSHSSDNGTAIYGSEASRAFFGASSIVQPVLDITSSGHLTTGYMSFGHVKIEDGATVDFVFSNTATISSADSIDIPFLESRTSGIDGNFTTHKAANLLQSRRTYGSSLFYDYALIKDEDGSKYSVRVTPRTAEETTEKNDNEDSGNNNENDTGNSEESSNGGSNTAGKTILKPSALLSKANYAAAKAVETGLSASPAPGKIAGYDLLNLAYDKLYNSKTVKELEQHARGLHAYQATRFPSLITTSHDRFSYSFQRELTRAAVQPLVNQTENPDPKQNSWVGWIKPLGGNENYYANGVSYRGLSVNYGGLTIGTAGHYRKVTTGLAAGFMQGRLNASEGYSADTQNLLITTGLTTNSFNISSYLKPFVDLGASYGLSRFEQKRRDTLGGMNSSTVHANSLRLILGIGQEYFIRHGQGLRIIPKATLDYTYIRQDQYKEYGGYLPLSVSASKFNSLRPKIGSELLWAINPQLALNTYGYYRYELLDSRQDLDTRFVALPEIRFVTLGEDTNRSSANIGFEMTYQAWENLSVSGSYDLLATKDYKAHQLYIQSNARF